MHVSLSMIRNETGLLSSGVSERARHRLNSFQGPEHSADGLTSLQDRGGLLPRPFSVWSLPVTSLAF